MPKGKARRAKPAKKVDLMAAVPFPAQAKQIEAVAQLAGTSLWYADTGGKGEPVVLMHPAATGNPLIWGYQQPVLAKAGYRVIAYARRGYYKSGPVDPAYPGNSTEDLRGLADHLGLGKFHLVSTAAGGSVASDFALSYPDRLLSLAVTSNYAGVREGSIFEAAQRLRPAQWNELPRWFREFGPSYIVSNQEGLKGYIDLQDEATQRKGIEQHANFVIRPETLKKNRVPTLLLTGDADLSTPPALMKMVAAQVPDNELVIVPESGHSPFWEYPRLFNKVLLDFLGRHRAKKAAKKAPAAKPKAKARARKKKG